MLIHPQQFATHSLNRSSTGEDICKILAAAIQGADAREAVKRNLWRDGDQLIVGLLKLNVNMYKRILVIGAGKASVPMADGVLEILDDRITTGLVITKKGYLNPEKHTHTKKIKVIQASHPLPDQLNIEAASNLLSTINGVNCEDLVLFLLSGGGSALLMCPPSGITLEDIQCATALLLSVGASILEINTVRKHLDLFKGGGLAKLLSPATVITLTLSDVVDDRIDMIASGPTAADPTTYKDAWTVLEKYKVIDQVPPAIRRHIEDGMAGNYAETVKPGDPVLEKVTNIIVGSNQDALLSSDFEARELGFTSRIINPSLKGEASHVGAELCEQAKILLSGAASLPRPACLIAGGETTVTIKGSGLGGRNQELALGAVSCLSGTDPLTLITLATDGGDGPTDAAGAVVTNETHSRGLSLGLDPQDYLDRNDSYHFFERLGDLIKIGPTLTNVNDLVFIFGL